MEKSRRAYDLPRLGSKVRELRDVGYTADEAYMMAYQEAYKAFAERYPDHVLTPWHMRAIQEYLAARGLLPLKEAQVR